MPWMNRHDSWLFSPAGLPALNEHHTQRPQLSQLPGQTGRWHHAGQNVSLSPALIALSHFKNPGWNIWGFWGRNGDKWLNYRLQHLSSTLLLLSLPVNYSGHWRYEQSPEIWNALSVSWIVHTGFSLEIWSFSYIFESCSKGRKTNDFYRTGCRINSIPTFPHFSVVKKNGWKL